jgi:carbamoyltransferase
MIILGVYTSHDAGAALFDDYRRIASVALERPTRIKGDGNRFPTEAVEECLAQAGLRAQDVDVIAMPRVDYPTRYYKPRAWLPWPKAKKNGKTDLIRVMSGNFIRDPEAAFDARRYLAELGFNPKRAYFYNHHLAHALTALFHTRWDDALLYTSDGGGDRVYYSLRQLRDGRLTDVFGGEADSIAFRRPQHGGDSLGNLYLFVTAATGFQPLRHEGKVLGLAAFGEPVRAEEMKANYRLMPNGEIRAVKDMKDISAQIHALAKTTKREDLAASAQKTLEDLTLASLKRALETHPAKNLGVAGGVFANVKLTQRIAEKFPFEEIFVYPAMSDQGEATGGVLQFLCERDGLATWLKQRAPLGNVYFGRDYMDRADAAFLAGAKRVDAPEGLAETAARLIAEGKVVGTYLGRGEYGPRALGARSIMAAPVDRAINDWLNKRLDRTDFMPFAPVVREERCDDVFELPMSLYYSARYMTVTCNVREEWRAKIPAVVHVDGTARPQLARRQDNPVYYDILHAYERRTGVPVTINTSFNVHEEPIINKPEEALKALEQGRVDYLVTEQGLYAKA